MSILSQSYFFVSRQIMIYLTYMFVLLCLVTAVENVYERTKDTVLQNTFKTLTSPSRVVCCAYCDQTADCMSVSYQNSSKTCKLASYPLVSVLVNGQTDTTWNSYSKNGKTIL